MFTLLQVTLRQETASNGQISGRVTRHLAANADTIERLVMVILALLGLLAAYRIYAKWQAGEDQNIVWDISKWFLGMVLCLSLLFGLKLLLQDNSNTGGFDINWAE